MEVMTNVITQVLLMGKIIPLIRINTMNVVVLIMTDSHLIVPEQYLR